MEVDNIVETDEASLDGAQRGDGLLENELEVDNLGLAIIWVVVKILLEDTKVGELISEGLLQLKLQLGVHWDKLFFLAFLVWLFRELLLSTLLIRVWQNLV